MDNPTKIKAVARANAFHGLFQAILQPEGVLTMDEIAERWADYAKIEHGFAKLQLRGFEVVFDEPIPKGKYLLTVYTRCNRGTDFKLVHCRHEVRAV